jgi:aryl carrier-like protein
VHSFQAARLVARLHKRFGPVVTLRSLYRNPTPSRFAAWLDATAPEVR